MIHFTSFVRKRCLFGSSWSMLIHMKSLALLLCGKRLACSPAQQASIVLGGRTWVVEVCRGHLKESWKLNGPELSMSDAQVRKATLGDAPAEGRVSETFRLFSRLLHIHCATCVNRHCSCWTSRVLGATSMMCHSLSQIPRGCSDCDTAHDCSH